MKGAASLEQVLAVSEAFSRLPEPHAMVGGAVVGLYLTDPAAESPRPTLDVDVVVEIATYAAFAKLEEKLRKMGFVHDTTPGAPICRWRYRGILVDVMPANESVLQWRRGWFEEALRQAREVPVPGNRRLRLVPAPFYVATKLEAFLDRGRADPMMSRDLEDLVILVDGRPELTEEVASAPAKLRGFLGKGFCEILDDPRLREAVTLHLPTDAVHAERARIVLERMEGLARPGR